MSKKNGNEVPFYKRAGVYKKSGIMSLIGCVLMVAATFLYWMMLYVKTTATDFSGLNIFMTCFRSLKGKVGFQAIISAVFLLLYYAVVILLAVIGIKDNITKTEIFTKYKKRTRLGLVLGVIVLMILMTHIGSIGNAIGQYEGLRDNWTMFIKNCKDSGVPGADSMNCIYAVGPGFICFIVGVVLYIASIIFSFMLDTLNED